ACGNDDRTRALIDGRMRPEGIDLNVLSLPVEETFFRMLRHREFDAAEMSLSSYTLSLFQPAPPFIAIPAFPKPRHARHLSPLLARARPREDAAGAGAVVRARSARVFQDLTHPPSPTYPTSMYTRPLSTTVM